MMLGKRKITTDVGLDMDRRFVHIAQALAWGYTDLYYVNIATDEFIEYRTDESQGLLVEVRRGNDFFPGCARDAKKYIHKEDQKLFVGTMKRAFLEEALKEKRTYEFHYRRLLDKKPIYVRMHITRTSDDPNYIVIAVSDIDELTKQRQMDARIREERSVYAHLQALVGNFICVYVIDPETDAYREFSASNDYTENFSQAKSGERFFDVVRKVAKEFNHPEDLDRFLDAFTKEKIIAEIESSGLFVLVYRLMMEGKPRYVQMSAAMVVDKEGKRLVVGLNDIDAQYRQKEAASELSRQKDLYGQIAYSLAGQYDTLYYVDVETNEYVEISATEEYKKLHVPTTGNDFFAESRRSIRRYVHPEDMDKAIAANYKEAMLEHLEKAHSFSMSWRLVVDGKVRYIRHTSLLAKDGRHIIVSIKNIDAEIEAERALEEDKKKSVTFTQIAERLADRYDFIYYIDCKTGAYMELSAKIKLGELYVNDEGKDFFKTSHKNAEHLVYAEDRERIVLFLDRDNLISKLETRQRLVQDYRMSLDGRLQFTRMSVTYSSDKSHFIICVENRDEEVRKEKEHLQALSNANEMARRDDLTHTKNKTAYHEAAKELQRRVEKEKPRFSVVICDLNDLKTINDTEGHAAGDDCIKSASILICHTFLHSPVYRIGGDEFALFLEGEDFENRDRLIANIRRQIEENVRMGEGVILAVGIADYIPRQDKAIEDVFKRADTQMYADKARLKELKLLLESRSLKQKAEVRVIDEERRRKVDTLFKAFDIVAEGTYVYLCDMKFDFSRWSKSAVDTFGLPSEYMYGAGDIWENHIHPEDRAAYHQGIDEIFSGIASGHDMQYRARRSDGEYDVCTCRGIVIRDVSGEPDYFVGTIRNHGSQGHIDTLTGLRNQYGFFEDLDGAIKRCAEVRVCLFGITRFSEVNEMYGYRFGNRVLQQYARLVFERIGNAGHTYRIDGPKFAIISNTLSIDELHRRYDALRVFLHEHFSVDGRHILLDLHSGAVNLDRFDIDSQTIYACLNYADDESKLQGNGNMTVFSGDLNETSQQRLEMINAIRLSIMHGCEGFYLRYQPVVDAKSERLIGAEALLRWKSEQYGNVPPDKFIHIIESDTLYPELGEWILREAIVAAKQARKKYRDFIVNVNLSYTQIQKPDFVDMVASTLATLDYPANHLCLEVTERCRLLDVELIKNVVVSLRSMGVVVALDDFGTGFSSTSILKDIPVSLIKIDRSFVKSIETEEIDRQLVRNIVDLAAIFGAKVCVEGIESKGMRNVLRGYHVGSFQGFYYGKPLDIEQLLAWKKP
ncbi:MAG: EAL domain-containing protein [Bacilli bacterium]|nr:EAL domain-containing protein [Bacilli bacterium]